MLTCTKPFEGICTEGIKVLNNLLATLRFSLKQLFARPDVSNCPKPTIEKLIQN